MTDREILKRNQERIDKIQNQLDKNFDLLIRMESMKGFKIKIYRRILRFCIKVELKLQCSYIKENLNIFSKSSK